VVGKETAPLVPTVETVQVTDPVGGIETNDVLDTEPIEADPTAKETVPEIAGNELIPTFCPDAKETAAPNVGVPVVGLEIVTEGNELMPTFPDTGMAVASLDPTNETFCVVGNVTLAVTVPETD